jgi:hypothetical protein
MASIKTCQKDFFRHSYNSGATNLRVFNLDWPGNNFRHTKEYRRKNTGVVQLYELKGWENLLKVINLEKTDIKYKIEGWNSD